LEYQKSTKLFPKDYFFDKSINKDEYKKIKWNAFNKVKKIWF
jgi:hypothetical protein